MLRTIIKKNSYQDSVVLMLLTSEISKLEGVNRVSIMMATPANKDIFAHSGLATPEMEAASANDMAIILDMDNEEKVEKVLAEVDAFLARQSQSSGSTSEKTIKSWESALSLLPDANLAVISVPGVYTASVAQRALDEGLNVFIFSDNVKKEEEVRLKQYALEKGLLCMGPDCGTGILHGVPIAFTNHVRSGSVGVVGASGTGIQEVTATIDRLGEGVSAALGTGGRDLSEEVGGITMLSALAALAEDDATKVITILSKPPAKSVRDRIMNEVRGLNKPVVTLFLGEKPDYHEEGLYHAYTLEEAARLSVALARGEDPQLITAGKSHAIREKTSKTIKAYYSGGTLAAEAAMLMGDALFGASLPSAQGYVLKHQGFEVLDLGDDAYTQGKPHPMMDPTTRLSFMESAAEDPTTGVLLFDVVLGYGSHEDMAGALAPSIDQIRRKAQAQQRELFFVAALCGTKMDPQGYERQKKTLEDRGVIVCETNQDAVDQALALIGYEVEYPHKEIRQKAPAAQKVSVEVSESQRNLMKTKPRIINIGLKSFYETFKAFPCEVIQYDWKPAAGGDVELMKVLDFLRNVEYEN